MKIRELLILVAGNEELFAVDTWSLHQGSLAKLNDSDSSPSELRTRMLTR
jgi:hypothetical protein